MVDIQPGDFVASTAMYNKSVIDCKVQNKVTILEDALASLGYRVEFYHHRVDVGPVNDNLVTYGRLLIID